MGPVRGVDRLLEPKVLVAENLHHHHCLAITAGRVRVTLAKDIHDGNLAAILGVDLEFAEELLREPAPSRKAFLADGLYLCIVQQPLARLPEFAFKLLSQNCAVFEQRIFHRMMVSTSL